MAQPTAQVIKPWLYRNTVVTACTHGIATKSIITSHAARYPVVGCGMNGVASSDVVEIMQNFLILHTNQI